MTPAERRSINRSLNMRLQKAEFKTVVCIYSVLVDQAYKRELQEKLEREWK